MKMKILGRKYFLNLVKTLKAQYIKSNNIWNILGNIIGIVVLNNIRTIIV